MNLNRDSESQGINEPEINVVSLIDVVLLLVVFFMVSSTFVEEGRINASSVPVNSTIVDPIVVTVTAQGAYRVNERSLINNSPETLRAALLRMTGERRKIPVTIRADARATHQSVVTAMDVIGRLGFAQINIATLNDQGGR